MTRSKLTLPRKDDHQTPQAQRLQFSGGRYITRNKPRSGGLASVYRGTDVDTGKEVAIKVFLSADGTDEVIEESFRREVQALSDLNHPNIVRIIDSGRDEELGAHFIVMDWVERDLKSVCESRPFHNWDEFYRTIGKGVLDGLVFAYSRSTVHRDIKPSNILVTEDWRPKICDFGISKIRDFLAPGVTLAQFTSAPYAPPEADDGSYSYSRDVFGYAALVIASLCETPLTTHRELLSALEKIQLDEGVRRLLRRCLALDDPAARPGSVLILQSELQRLKSTVAQQLKGTLLFALTKRVRGIVEHDLGLQDDDVERFVERDLEAACCDEIAPTDERPDRSIRLYGQKYGYTAAVEKATGKLTLTSAREYLPSEMERKRAGACEVDYKFALRGPGGSDGIATFDGFLEQILEFSADQKQRVLDQREQALYRTWTDLLSAKTDLEKSRRASAQYRKAESSGEFIRLTMAPGSETDLMTDKDIVIDCGAKKFNGSVISYGDGYLLIAPNERNKAEHSELPVSGKIEVDTTKSDVALDKQKSAVEVVRFGRSVNPDLGRYILNPDSIPVPVPADVDFIQAHIDDDKREAVKTALSGPPLMLVEGPPGTGKTTFITELVLQFLRQNPNARVLLTSQTHVALDNSLERIIELSKGKTRAVRIGHESDERISISSKKMLLDAKMPEMRKEALQSGREFIEQWALQHGLSLTDIRRAMALERHASLKARIEELDAGIYELQPQMTDDAKKALDAEQRADLDERMEGLTHERDEIAKELKESLRDLGQYVEDKNDLKEYANCSAADLRVWADAHANGTDDGLKLKKLVISHAEWEARFGRSREFKAAVIASSQIVAGTCLGVMGVPGRNEITYDLCIVDEASIATPTEVLVPMSRARRTVLVGDNQQLSPFQDPHLRTSGLLSRYNLTVADQKATLFRHLTDGLPTDLHKTLTTQHRMIPAIGNLISECFYGGRLKSVEREEQQFLSKALPRPVTWYSTSKITGRKSTRVGTSYHNDYEIQQVVTLLSRIDFFIQKGRFKDKKISVAVLTGYGDQKQRLRTAIQTRKHEWNSYSEIFINVVDAFQGRESDMVIFSVTRSEVDGLGFLKEMERINVALSRARELLAIVGDHVYCQTAEEAQNPLKDVVDYIRRHPDTCALEELQQ
ncbi:AAA domain-containing protein [Methylolobus aquaticus]